MLKIIGHRFFSEENLENSMSGILLSISKKAWGVETDIQLTRDGVPVLLHDKLLDRTTNQSGYLKDWSFAELEEHCLLNNGEKIPSLESFLSLAYRENIKIYLELIDPNSLEITLKYIKKYYLEERSVISSFHHSAIYRAKEISPSQRTMALFECNPLNVVGFLKSTKADEAGIGLESISENLVENLNAANIETYAWTVNSEVEAKRAEEYGLTGIFTDRVKLHQLVK